MGPEKTQTFKLNNKKTTTTFKYPEVVSNHYRYRDMIDNHNGMRMHPIALEETWITLHWPNRVFSFLLVVTVVNVQNTATYFFNKEKINTLTETYEECGGANILEMEAQRTNQSFSHHATQKKLSKMDEWWHANTHIRGRHVVSAALNVADPTAPAPQG